MMGIELDKGSASDLHFLSLPIHKADIYGRYHDLLFAALRAAA